MDRPVLFVLRLLVERANPSCSAQDQICHGFLRVLLWSFGVNSIKLDPGWISKESWCPVSAIRDGFGGQNSITVSDSLKGPESDHLPQKETKPWFARRQSPFSQCALLTLNTSTCLLAHCFDSGIVCLPFGLCLDQILESETKQVALSGSLQVWESPCVSFFFIQIFCFFFCVFFLVRFFFFFFSVSSSFFCLCFSCVFNPGLSNGYEWYSLGPVACFERSPADLDRDFI